MGRASHVIIITFSMVLLDYELSQWETKEVDHPKNERHLPIGSIHLP